ncbi:MAG: DUF3048 domain-containing protein [Clostridia bacterium]|nr:DUF3048 domain-containing protein [Clostridia bacterium]
MRRYLALLLAVCTLLLCACAPKEEPQPTDPTQSTTEATEKETEPPTQEPTKAESLYHNPLTGEGMDEKMTARPFAVMLNNYKSALPIHGNSKADVIYEALTEGGMTRCMGVYTNFAAVEDIGCVRSARKHFANIAIGLDAIYIHLGASTGNVGAREYLTAMNWDHMDGQFLSSNSGHFYENQDRINAGYNPGDECHFLKPAGAIKYCKDAGFVMDRGEELDYGLKFDDEMVIVGEKADTLTVWFNQGGTPGSWTKYTKLSYDKQTKQYLSYQFDQENIDGATGEILGFRNVFVLKAPTKKNATSSHMIIDLEGEGTGYFACNGQLVPIKWSRKNANTPFTYTLEDGTPLTLGVGKSYVAVVPTNATIEWQ